MKRIRSSITLGLVIVTVSLPLGCLCMIPHALLHKKKAETKSEATDSKKKGEKESEEGKATGGTKSEGKEKKEESQQHQH